MRQFFGGAGERDLVLDSTLAARYTIPVGVGPSKLALHVRPQTKLCTLIRVMGRHVKISGDTLSAGRESTNKNLPRYTLLQIRVRIN